MLHRCCMIVRGFSSIPEEVRVGIVQLRCVQDGSRTEAHTRTNKAVDHRS